MRNWLPKTFLITLTSLSIYGFYLSAKSQQTKEIVSEGVAAKNATIKSLVVENKQAKQEAQQAKEAVAAVVQKAVDSTSVVIQKKQEVIDSLINKMPNEAFNADTDTNNPDAVLRALAAYKPSAVILANGDTIY